MEEENKQPSPSSRKKMLKESGGLLPTPKGGAPMPPMKPPKSPQTIHPPTSPPAPPPTEKK